MQSSRGGSSSRTTRSTCATSTSSHEKAQTLCAFLRRLTKSLNFEAPQSNRFIWTDACLARRDVDLLFGIVDTGDVWKQQSSPCPTFVGDNYAVNARIQITQRRFFSR